MNSYREKENFYIVKVFYCPYNMIVYNDLGEKVKEIHWSEWFQIQINELVKEGLSLLSHSIATGIEAKNPYLKDSINFYGIMISCVFTKL